jgi:hypothetical protein
MPEEKHAQLQNSFLIQQYDVMAGRTYSGGFVTIIIIVSIDCCNVVGKIDREKTIAATHV